MAQANYYLSREIEKARAKHKPITIRLPAVPGHGDDDPGYAECDVELPPAQLWDDETTTAAAINPPVGARRLLGEHYAHWVAAGGTSGILFDIFRAQAGAASVGESPAS